MITSSFGISGSVKASVEVMMRFLSITTFGRVEGLEPANYDGIFGSYFFHLTVR